MANIGSAFLGDLQAKRIRHLSSPPPSPTTATLENSHRMSVPLPPPQSQQDEQLGKPWATLAEPSHKATIDPILALELRVRWLEVLVLGTTGSVNVADKNKSRTADEKRQRGRGNARSRQSAGSEEHKEKARDRGKGTQITDTLAQLTEKVTKRLKAIVETNEGLRKFMNTYDQYAQYLTPTFAVSGTIDVPLPSVPTLDNLEGTDLNSSLLPLHRNLSPEELEAYLAEMESDVRAADRDMLEIETFIGRGVTGAGRLGDCETLKPRLAKLIKEHRKDVELAHSLERHVERLVERHVTQVDALSELFVAWDNTLLEFENRTNQLEKETRERQRLGLEPQLS